MINIKTTIIYPAAITLVLGLSCVAKSYAVEGTDASSQALEQLRMLQKKLGGDGSSTEDSPSTTSSNNSSKSTEAPPVKHASQVASPPVTESESPPEHAVVPSKAAAEAVDDLAFQGLLKQLFPLSSEQTIRLKEMYQASEYARATTPGTPPKPVATSQFVNLSPGSTPPAIRLAQGFVSSLVFLDSTGAPWPISAYDLGDPAAFNIQWDKAGNTLMIQSNKLYTYGNLAVRLRGLNTPVMLTLIPGQKAVDYRVDLRVQGHGPNAKATVMEEGIPPAASNVLLHVLDGVPEYGSTKLNVVGGDAQAWLLRDRMYVRTNLTILSPGWLAIMTSADGMHAYEMQKSPVLLVSWHGKVMQLKVEGL